MDDDGPLAAGRFSTWLAEMESALRGDGEADVPCNGCTACCRSSQFIHIEPDETDALDHIPSELLFPAPKLPVGHVLLGYDENGCCPMLVDGGCSIYDHRPRTCRTYDCRIFAAAGVGLDEDGTRVEVAQRVRRWRFEFDSDDDRVLSDAVRAAAHDPAAVGSPTERALRAVRLHDRFLDVEAGAPDHQVRAMAGTVRLDVDGSVATITNDNPEKHNAFDDDMDAQLFEILRGLKERPEIRVVIWRGEGKSFSSGRDVGAIGTLQVPLSHHELMRRGHRGIQQLWELDAPVIVACKGWVMGGSFQRALLCDIRVAAAGTRFRLPETTYGVIPDTGGVAVLHEMCGPGLVSDMVLTGRVLEADEALAHGIVSRVVPADELDATVHEMAERIAAAPAVTIKMAREVIRHLSVPQVRTSMADEMIYQTFINKSDDMSELRAARAEDRAPRYSGS